MSGLSRMLKGWAIALVRRMDRANADRQRWMMGLPVYTADRHGTKRS